MKSMDMVAKYIEELEEIFPDCVTEARDEKGKLQKVVNLYKLMQKFGNKMTLGTVGGHSLTN